VHLSFVETDYTVDEDAGVQHICVQLTGMLDTSINVAIHSQPNTALGMLKVVWDFTVAYCNVHYFACEKQKSWQSDVCEL